MDKSTQYNPSEIEPKWRDKWEQSGIYKTPSDVTRENKYYILPQLPYPSGSGLHVGHAEVYSACDILARFKRMKDKKVLQVIGWDAFGLPAENYAIKTNIHPRINTDQAIDNFREQIKKMGVSVDWDREVGSHNPDYYKWTQWFFLLMYNQGLAYRRNQKVNWCPSCKTVLANEQVLDVPSAGLGQAARTDTNGTVEVCERCGTEIEHRMMEQWYLKITEYADRLASDLDKVDWPEESIKRQRDWIGRSEGAKISFPIAGEDRFIEVFTTRPDTIFGATYIVLAPEHPLVESITTEARRKRVLEYTRQAKKKTEIERTDQTKEKTGLFTGAFAVNPANDKNIPIWIADYVLLEYGTGAIMAVPAHDERDYEFAKQFDLPIEEVVMPVYGEMQPDEEYRETISAVIQRKSDGKFLFIRWQKEGWISPVIGGIDKGEDALKAAEREVYEETGYKAKAIKTLGGKIESHFYNSHKDVNRYRVDQPVLLELVDETPREISEEEKNIQEAIWLDFDEAKQLNNFEYNLIGFKRFLGIERPFTGKGRVINSGKFVGMSTDEANEAIINWLEQKGLGQQKITYKLRDWSVSRQRFWGAPIPMLHRELGGGNQAVNAKYQQNPDLFINFHAWASSAQEAYHPWVEEQLQSKGIGIISPELPNADRPILDEWLKTVEDKLSTLSFGKLKTSLPQGDNLENVVVSGRSLGGWAALKFAETHKIRKLILVAPSTPTPRGFESWKEYVDDDAMYQLLVDFIGGEQGNVDFDKVKENVGEVVFIHSVDDPYLNLEQSEAFLRSKLPFLRTVRFRDAGHFSVKTGFSTFPKLLEEILAEVRLDLKPASMDDLPVILPDDVDFRPTGQSPLTYSKEFQEGVREKYGPEFSREPDTLDTFMCSSWYYYRYLDPHNDEAFASSEALKKWMPVDFYLGGPEHVNGHLLYSRFFTKVLYDAGYIDFDEPFLIHRHQGLILGEDNRKMSKRWGNIINPSDVVDKHGADTLRMYEMFMGPLTDTKPWDTKGEQGVFRFINKVWNLQFKVAEISNEGQSREAARLTSKVEEGIENLSFNTSVAKFMEFSNFLQKQEVIAKDVWENFLLILSPFAPFITEELWSRLGHSASIHTQTWPEYDSKLLQEDRVTIVVQINGKIRDTLEVAASTDEITVKEAALQSNKVKKYTDQGKIKRTIFVKDKLISFVIV